MSWETLREVLYGLVPTAGVLLVFTLVVRAILRADESERRAAREFGDGDGEAGPGGTAAPESDR
jgi:hypothetical protein